MRRITVAVCVPILIILGSLIGFLALKSLGVFADRFSFYFSLSLPICVYLSSLVVWTISPFQKDIIPTIVAISAFGGFLIGSILLTNLVGLGFSPVPALDIFFTQEGLSRTLPYFFQNLNSSKSPNLDQSIFSFLMIPIATSFLGIFLACFIQLEKPISFKDRLQKSSIRALLTLFITFLLFFPLKSLLLRSLP